MADTVLAEFIRQRGSRQTYLAECAGVSPSHLNRALKLERPLSADAVAIIADRLGVPFAEIYDGQGLRARTDGAVDAKNAPSDAPASTGDRQVMETDTPARGAA